MPAPRGAGHVASSIGRRSLAFRFYQDFKVGAGRARLDPAGLLVETAQCTQALFAAELRLLDGVLEDRDGPVVHAQRHREGMPVLAAVGERETRRIREPAGCAVDDLRHGGERLDGARADSWLEEQVGEVLGSVLCGRGESGVI